MRWRVRRRVGGGSWRRRRRCMARCCRSWRPSWLRCRMIPARLLLLTSPSRRGPPRRARRAVSTRRAALGMSYPSASRRSRRRWLSSSKQATRPSRPHLRHLRLPRTTQTAHPRLPKTSTPHPAAPLSSPSIASPPPPPPSSPRPPAAPLARAAQARHAPLYVSTYRRIRRQSLGNTRTQSTLAHQRMRCSRSR